MSFLKYIVTFLLGLSLGVGVMFDIYLESRQDWYVGNLFVELATIERFKATNEPVLLKDRVSTANYLIEAIEAGLDHPLNSCTDEVKEVLKKAIDQGLKVPFCK